MTGQGNKPEITDIKVIPEHVAIIMDGNGRWASLRGLPRFEGHRRGVESVRKTVKASIEIGIKYLTIFSFSAENWSRPAAEIMELMGLLKRFIRHDLADLNNQNVRMKIIGERENLSKDLRLLLDEAETSTAANTGLILTVAFNYGGRQEILRAAQAMAKAVEEGKVKAENITKDTFEGFLDTAGTPPPDLLIRTSGEQRISNFLLWQCAYSEFVFLPVLWPDFDKSYLESALLEYGGRERRYGSICHTTANKTASLGRISA